MLVYIELAVAILPAALLLLLVYKKDKNGKEPKELLWKLIGAGGLIIIPIIIYEYVGQIVMMFINALITGSTDMGFWVNFLVYFGIVAFAEEGCKMIALAILTWKNDNFNFKYDGIVYAVFVGMGFAIFENVKYVIEWRSWNRYYKSINCNSWTLFFCYYNGNFLWLSKILSIS